MRKCLVVIIMLAVATLACSFSNTKAEPTAAGFVSFPTSTPFVQVITNTPGPTATNAPPTSTPFGSNNNSSGNNGSVRCFVRGDWPIYIVQKGDTLAAIARSIGTDVNTLSNANCLTNPNSLSVGQSLRVPFVPQPTAKVVTATPPPNNPGVVGAVVFSEYNSKLTNEYYVPRGKTITITYPEAGANVSKVDFVLTLTKEVDVFIASDTNLGDGAAVQWTVPDDTTSLYIRAIGRDAANTIRQTSAYVRANPDFINEGSVSVEPSSPTPGATNIVVEPGSVVTITYAGARTNLSRAEFYLFAPNSDAWTTIGLDGQLADGVSMQWTVPDNLNGHVILVTTYGANGLPYQKASSSRLYSSVMPIGMIDITPFIARDASSFTLTPGVTVTVGWPEVPTNATKVDFYLAPAGNIGEPTVIIGTDNNLADGAQVGWTVPNGVVAHVYAKATLSDGKSSQSGLAQVYSN